MKPSEVRDLKQWRVETDEKLLAVEEYADPKISQAEAREAKQLSNANCINWHNGLIALTMAKDGSVHWCPQCNSAWRYSRSQYKRLNYSRKGIV